MSAADAGTNGGAKTYPRTVALAGGGDVELRFMRAGDEAAVLAFARELPAHDLLFLPRDITQPKVLAAWVSEIERGALTTLLPEFPVPEFWLKALIPTNKIRKAAVQNLLHWIKQRMQPAPPWAQ